MGCGSSLLEADENACMQAVAHVLTTDPGDKVRLMQKHWSISTETLVRGLPRVPMDEQSPEAACSANSLGAESVETVP